ncbi:hypothetical protein FQA47_019609, partial [Oryzias melastigma]
CNTLQRAQPSSRNFLDTKKETGSRHCDPHRSQVLLKQYLQVKTKNQAPYVSDWAKPTLGGYNYDVKFASATIA